MTLTRCDRCGRVMKNRIYESYAFNLTGWEIIRFRDRDGKFQKGVSFKFDLCKDCARDVVEMIERGISEEEGQACTRD